MKVTSKEKQMCLTLDDHSMTTETYFRMGSLTSVRVSQLTNLLNEMSKET